tara:strand:- start:403 stop:801 length:399 start_codon:yes stop_codon:yes gene_type:complete
MKQDGRQASGSSDNTKGQPAFREAALFGLCPRCGARTLFAGWVSFADRCSNCALDYTRFNVGDGPAAFLTLIIGAIIVGLAAWLAVAVAPPWWVHLLLWLPLGIGLTLGGLRIAKAALLWSEYRQKAGEAGR